MLDIEGCIILAALKWSIVLTACVTKVKDNDPPSKASFAYLLTL